MLWFMPLTKFEGTSGHKKLNGGAFKSDLDQELNKNGISFSFSFIN